MRKNRDNNVCMCEIIDKENGNNCMSAVAINTKVNIKTTYNLSLLVVYSSCLEVCRKINA